MFAEWYKPNSCLEFPRGGSQAMVNALVRSVLQAARCITLTNDRQVVWVLGPCSVWSCQGEAPVALHVV